MEFKIPFTFAPLSTLKRRAHPFLRFTRSHSSSSVLARTLEADNVLLSPAELRAICYRTALNAFLLLTLVLGAALFYLQGLHALPLAPAIALLIALFIAVTQLNYPRVFHARRQRNIEKNLISGLQDMLVQLNAGIPLFNILVNLSSADYGELSVECKKAVREMNAGAPQIEVLEHLSEQNESPYFRRTLWQLSNGMRAGSDISIIIRENVRALNEEQLIQIQNYGNKLNPLIMFYMLISVIIPALAVVFLTLLSSLVNLAASSTYALFISLFVFVMLLQSMFVGLVRSLRPSLL